MQQKQPYVAYLRVSTVRQGRHGLGIEAQRTAVSQFVTSQYGELLGPEFVEVESGKRDSRPELQKALRSCQVTGATLVVAKLDRLSRNAAFLMTLRDSGIQFVAVDLPAATTVTVGIMAVVAQYEREAISSRTRAALAAAKARGTKLGGWRPNTPNIADYCGAGIAALRAKANTSAELRRDAVERAIGRETTLRGIAAQLNSERVTTSKGKLWTPTAVSRVMARLHLERPVAQAVIAA
jgi:DNA invertase Pin-like site-specific DNA recombinase